jgi:hypothetical protein
MTIASSLYDQSKYHDAEDRKVCRPIRLKAFTEDLKQCQEGVLENNQVSWQGDTPNFVVSTGI